MIDRELEMRLRSWFRDGDTSDVPTALALRVAAIPGGAAALPWFRRPWLGRLPAWAAIVTLLLSALLAGALAIGGLRSLEPSPAPTSPAPSVVPPPAPGAVVAPADIDACSLLEAGLEPGRHGSSAGVGSEGASDTCHGPGYDGGWGLVLHVVWARHEVPISAVPDLLMIERSRFTGSGDFGPWVARRQGVWTATSNDSISGSARFHVAAVSADPYFFFATAGTAVAALDLADAVVSELERLNGGAWRWPWPTASEALLPAVGRCLDAGGPSSSDQVLEAYWNGALPGTHRSLLFADGRLVDLSALWPVEVIRNGDPGWTVQRLGTSGTEDLRRLVLDSGVVRAGCNVDLAADGPLRGVHLQYPDGREGDTDIGTYGGFETEATAPFVAAIEVLLRHLAAPEDWLTPEAWQDRVARPLRPDAWMVRATIVPAGSDDRIVDESTPLATGFVLPDGSGLLDFGSARDLGDGQVERWMEVGDREALALLEALDAAGNANSLAYFFDSAWHFRLGDGGVVSVSVSPSPPG